MRQRDRGSLTDSDPHDLFYGPSDADALLDDHLYGAGYSERVTDGDDRHADPAGAPVPRGHRRAEAARHTRRHRNGRFVGLLALLLIGLVAVSAWLIALPLYHYLNPSDYPGTGSGAVVVVIRPNDGAKQIGDTLVSDGVVASTRAFTDVASNNTRATSIQPGSYRLRKHMSASSALGLLLDPSARVNADVVVTEGATVVDIATRLIAAPCTASSPTGTVCGLGLRKADVAKAVSRVDALGLPTDYKVGGKSPLSVEGFLFPATYAFDNKTRVTDALQQMVQKFTERVRSTNFTASAKALGITPYQELIIASIAQGEAKYAEDMPKVARVILNRLAIGKHLQVDATSAYAAKLKGLDPTKQIYSATKGPYNTYDNAGLPPTPIGNPGIDAMDAAAHPANGNWLFYVNKDAVGHLFFTHSEAEFKVAANKCHANHWGCARV